MQLSWIISSSEKLSILSVGRYTYTSDLRFQPVMRDDPADDSETWTLRIRRVKLEDEAKYECQINTKPEKSRHIYLRVVGELVLPFHNPKIFKNQVFDKYEIPN